MSRQPGADANAGQGPNIPGGPDQAASESRSAAEWTTLVMSVLVVLGVVGLVTVLHVGGGDDPPVIAVEPMTDTVRRETDGYYLTVEVRNRGDRTAENVQVQAELDTGSGTPLTADFTIPFLAGGELVEGTFVFAEDPAQGDLTIEATSYQEP